ncbi:MAG: threonine synthase [Calditrichaceae bacterium]|nr:threonine synthase [Calditrichaceae bacterium]MBN2708271.1 threonine synthase [Calditrichaceae bacterium]RQV95198.1 MAG: threonine synthase [Calditrichota bacterium]
MKYFSTNDPNHIVDFRTAVMNGLAPDGGLYMPENIPGLKRDFIENLNKTSLPEIGLQVINEFADNLSRSELEAIVYDAINFKAPLIELDDHTSVLELFHGPTLAFKDFGARFLARLMQRYHQNENKELIILVATSGDTGSAVANGFLGMDGIKVGLLYPSGMVSKIQEQQLTTIGGNVTAFEINGNFDDCQRLVKKAFTDEFLKKKYLMSSANSINLARLLPQTFYYFSAYGQSDCSKDQKMLLCVPSGNFGNLTAGLIAGKMGLPVEHYIAAVNANHVFTDYLASGLYHPHPAVKTLSNAMDVGDPSNFSRILALYNQNFSSISDNITGYSISDQQTIETIKEVYKSLKYIVDPHGAVGYEALKKYREETGLVQKAVFLETAHPGKFAEIVENTLEIKIDLPESLALCMKKEKMAVFSPPDFNPFREILISHI